MAERINASFLRRPWLHDLGSTRTLITLLRPWIRRFTIITSAWWLWTSIKISGQKFDEIHGNIRPMETPISRCRFLQPRSCSHCNEKCADRPTVSVWRCPVIIGGEIWATTTTTTSACKNLSWNVQYCFWILQSARADSAAVIRKLARKESYAKLQGRRLCSAETRALFKGEGGARLLSGRGPKIAAFFYNTSMLGNSVARIFH